MANNPQLSIEKDFIGGLKTEFTGLNFPENACTAAENTIFSIIGEATRREGFDFEANYTLNSLASSTNAAINTYKWNNVGGDGLTQIIVNQIGSTLYFYLASSATITNPLSSKKLTSTVNIATFVASGGSFDPAVECQFTDGNGYLFVFNSNCDPFYCTYNSSTQTITATVITLQVRDFIGINDGFQVGAGLSIRPTTLSDEHAYNLYNQGWGLTWTGFSASTNTVGTGSFTFIVNSATLPISVGQLLQFAPTPRTGSGNQFPYIVGTVTSYTGTTVVITETAKNGTGTFHNWTVGPVPSGTAGDIITQWFTVLGNYPANCDQWWSYRDTNVTHASPDGTFKPQLANTGYILPVNSQAPQGAIIFNPFIQNRAELTGLGVTDTSTTVRPSNGCWFQGRVFYTGVNASSQPTGDAPYTTWTENIYFSQIVTTPNNFGLCYQQNDPTSPTLFNLLPSDGGVITIQGSGSIYKLFPLQNGLIVFAANGIWFIGGSSGVGFAANSYFISKISNVQSISTSSFVNVLGYPLFWNEEGIYHVKPAQQGGSMHSPDIALDVQNLCVGTILSFYQNIPLQSKKFARGDYDPTTYIIQWVYRATNETTVTSRYQFDSALNINTYKGPFYPYFFTVSPSTVPVISGINYVAGPGGSTSPSPTFKYFTVYQTTNYTFSEERDNTNWKDWASIVSTDYISTFTTGYKLHGQAQRLWQVGYIYMYSDNTVPTAYSIQGLWNYGNSGNSGKWSTRQQFYNTDTNFGNMFRRIKIRGHGLALQLQITSISGQPFSFAGWSMFETINQSI